MSISIQLYSARNFMPWDDVISKTAECGIDKVEGFGGVYTNPAEFRDLMDRHGVTMPSGHFSIEMLENEFSGVIEMCKTLGIARVYCPFLLPDDRPTNSEGWAAFATRLEAIQPKLADNGLPFGWHNHDFEFHTLPDGECPMRILLEKAPSITWEADIAWIVRGGADPKDWIKRYGDRIDTAHVKDIAPDGDCLDEDGWADVGHGVIDWAALHGQLKEAGTDLFILEHDNPSDLDRFIRRSMDTMQRFAA